MKGRGFLIRESTKLRWYLELALENKLQEIALHYSIVDTADVYDHKKALKTKNNKAYTSLVVILNRLLYDKDTKCYFFVHLIFCVLNHKLDTRFE